MIVTEPEASGLLCPHFKTNGEYHGCHGSACMMWCWVGAEWEVKQHPRDEPAPPGWTLGWRPGNTSLGAIWREWPAGTRTGECGLIRQAVVEPG